MGCGDSIAFPDRPPAPVQGRYSSSTVRVWRAAGDDRRQGCGSPAACRRRLTSRVSVTECMQAMTDEQGGGHRMHVGDDVEPVAVSSVCWRSSWDRWRRPHRMRLPIGANLRVFSSWGGRVSPSRGSISAHFGFERTGRWVPSSGRRRRRSRSDSFPSAGTVLPGTWEVSGRPGSFPDTSGSFRRPGIALAMVVGILNEIRLQPRDTLKARLVARTVPSRDEPNWRDNLRLQCTR